MKMIKDGIIEDVTDKQIRRYSAQGWTPVEEAREEVIRLKPTVKTKNTAKILEEAKLTLTIEGDE